MAKFGNDLTPAFSAAHDSDAIRRQYPELYGPDNRAPYTEEQVRQYDIEHRTPVTEAYTEPRKNNFEDAIISRISDEDIEAPVRKAPAKPSRNDRTLN